MNCSRLYVAIRLSVYFLLFSSSFVYLVRLRVAWFRFHCLYHHRTAFPVTAPTLSPLVFYSIM